MNETRDDTIMRVEDLAVHFPMGGGLLGGPRRWLHAVDGVDLELKRGECLGLVGESGCGKSTLALSILGLQAPTRGRIVLDGHDVSGSAGRDRKDRAQIRPDGVPGPVFVAQSASDRPQDARSAASPARRHEQERDRRSDRRRAEACRPAARSGGALSRTSSPAVSASGSASRAR